MTYLENCSIVWWEEGMNASGKTGLVGLIGPMSPTSPWLAQHDLGADAFVGEDFEEERMPEPAVDQVRFADAGAEAVEARLHLGDHAAVDDAGLDELVAPHGVQTRHQGCWVRAVGQDSGRVAQKDELFGLQTGSDGGRG